MAPIANNLSERLQQCFHVSAVIDDTQSRLNVTVSVRLQFSGHVLFLVHS